MTAPATPASELLRARDVFAYLLAREQLDAVRVEVAQLRAKSRGAAWAALLDRADAAASRLEAGLPVLRAGAVVPWPERLLLDGRYLIDDRRYRVVSRPKGYLFPTSPVSDRTASRGGGLPGEPVRVLQMDLAHEDWRGVAFVRTTSGHIHVWKRGHTDKHLTKDSESLLVRPHLAFERYREEVGACPVCGLGEQLLHDVWACAAKSYTPEPFVVPTDSAEPTSHPTDLTVGDD